MLISIPFGILCLEKYGKNIKTDLTERWLCDLRIPLRLTLSLGSFCIFSRFLKTIMF